MGKRERLSDDGDATELESVRCWLTLF